MGTPLNFNRPRPRLDGETTRSDSMGAYNASFRSRTPVQFYPHKLEEMAQQAEQMLAGGTLNPNARSFVEQITAKIAKFGPDTLLSYPQNQWWNALWVMHQKKTEAVDT